MKEIAPDILKSNDIHHIEVTPYEREYNE